MLVGRDIELAWLAARRTAGVRGEAGIGKTSLLRAAAGAAACEGGGLAALRHVPFLPLSRALGGPPPDGDVASVGAWAVARARGRALVLDDLQWADLGTLSLLPALAARLRLLVGVRDGDEGTAAAVAAAEEASIELLRVRPLADGDARELLRRVRPELTGRAATRVVAAARGNPLFLEELTPAGEASPTLSLAVRARLARCSPAAREAMQLVCALGRPAARELVGGAAAELVREGVLVETQDGLAPRHALLAEEALAGVGAARRRLLHRRIAASLRDPGEIARHRAAAGDRPAAHAAALEAAGRATRPGERALHLALAAETATRERRSALRLAAAAAVLEAGDAARAAALLRGHRAPEARLLRGRALWLLGDVRAARAELRPRPGDDATLAIRLAVQDLQVRVYGPHDPAAVAEARAVWLRARRRRVEETRARWIYGALLYWFAGSRLSLLHLRAALASARAGGDFELESAAALNLVGAAECFGHPDEAREVAATTARRAAERSLRGPELEHRWCVARSDLHPRLDPAAAAEQLEDCLAEPLLGASRAQVAADLAVAYALLGRDADALAVLAEHAAGGDVWDRRVRSWAETEIAWLSGRARRAAAAVAELEEDVRFASYVAGMRAWTSFDRGLPVDERLPEPPPFDPYSPYRLEARALAQLQRGRRRHAARTFDRAAAAWRGRIAACELRCGWAAALALARAGERVEAVERLRTLERAADAAGAVPLATRIRGTLRTLGVSRPAARPRAQPLTRREAEVLELVGRGLSSAEIAIRVGVAESTVERLVRTAMQRLGARSRIHAAALAAQR